MKPLPGSPYPLGATWDGEGVNFAIYSEGATEVELCLFDDAGVERRAAMPSRTSFVWHAYLPGLAPGQRYGFRAHGPYEPGRGLRFNPHVVLLDPYALAVDGVERWDAGCFAYEMGSADDLRPAERDQLGVPRAVVVDTSFDWEGDEPLRTPMHRSVIYEAHVRGLTKLHPDVPEAMRGTYAGMAHPSVLRHLTALGITAIELMPVHSFVDDKMLVDRGLRNYWGYSTIGFFAPDVRYRSGPALGSEVREFKEMVKAFHRARIEVILDVVYNHTAEGNQLGPTFHFKGIDNTTYYRLVPDDPRYYFDYTGTGNTLNVRHPQVLAMIMDSLRYWATEMHVDGFRFDLASALARQLHEVDQLSSFFTLIHQSPELQHVKLIAEPWDVGEGGYQVGNFPVRWAEWNGRYRDSLRELWLGRGASAAEMGFRLTGSSDLYEAGGRRPSASVNLVTAHDGFTLADLVSYDHKHNDANGENGADGNDHERSWNCGVEGPSEEPAVVALRNRQRRNLIATLLLSQGTPMLTAGDELGKTQRGNNNAYCQDNELGWVDWHIDEEGRSFLEFTRRLLALRRAHPALHRAKFFQGRSVLGGDVDDLLWFRFDGQPMSSNDWNNPITRSFVMFLAGRGIDDLDEQGRPLVDDNLLLLVNASDVELTAIVPELSTVHDRWDLLVDTKEDGALRHAEAGERVVLAPHSLQFYRAPSRVVRSGGAVHTLGATYRLQLTSAFGFRDALAIVDYLHALGVTDVYTSPIMAAGAGSTHGYDVVDPRRLNDELGSEADFTALVDALHERGMGLLVDWVPNHMGIASGQNPWWDDVLENGPAAASAEYFDIDWRPAREDLENRVLLPILSEPYGDVLEKGLIFIEWGGDFFRLVHGERRLPLAPESVAPVLVAIVDRAAGRLDVESVRELESLLTALRHLPERHDTAPDRRKERAREKEVIKRRMARLVEGSPMLADVVREALDDLNGVAGMPSSFERLDGVLRSQAYRLASWRVAAEEINYRRFFDVNDLAAVRMESPEVFEQTHSLLLRLLSEKRIDALRLDHTDGLYDPYAYMHLLQRRFPHSHTGQALSPDDAARPLPILVEKILGARERLPATWPVDGTTGYDFIGAVCGLWVDGGAEAQLDRLYRDFTGDGKSFAEHVYESKQVILRFSLASEIQMLGRQLQRIAIKNRKWRDFTLPSLVRALSETIAAFEVYRTYVRDGEAPAEEDAQRIRDAIAKARKRAPSVSGSLFAFLEDLLLARSEATEEDRRAHIAFALRFQQLSGPAMAKSVEDTAFYRYHRLVCMNEVGSDPASFSVSIDSFHQQNVERSRSWPMAMLASSTHDTKRGEDTAARIAVLSEVPDEWRRHVERWAKLASGLKVNIDGVASPPRDVEYLFYQTLIGAWPAGWDGKRDREAFVARLVAFLHKATNEAKVHTSWTNPVPAFEKALERFVERLFANEAFVEEARKLSERIGIAGACNGLAQTVLKLCSPGVPDIYQGSELWNQSLVDPDNRSPVDYGERRRRLAEIDELAAKGRLSSLLERWVDGGIKLFVIRRLLGLRRDQRALFTAGDYQPIEGGDHLVAFARAAGAARMVCCVSRLPLTSMRGAAASLPSGWPIGSTWGERTVDLGAPGRYRNVLTDVVMDVAGPTPVSTLLAELPVAVLVREPLQDAGRTANG